MTTVITRESPRISELLKEKRKEDNRPKAHIYRHLGVAANTYNTWEAGMYVPGDEFAESLADYLDLDLQEVVWLLYLDRMDRAKGVYLSSLSRFPIAS